METTRVVKKQLTTEFSGLQIRIAELEALEIEHSKMEKVLKKQSHDLEERIKEINCLYGISKLVENFENSLDDIYQGVVDLIPDSWQYPEITCVCLKVNSKNFRTQNFKKTKWNQAADISIHGKKSGSLVVCYLEKRQENYEGPFLKEERLLLNAIAERIARTTERKNAEKALTERERQLKEQNRLLQEKNIALREVMNQTILGKKDLEEKVLANVDQLIIPLLKKLSNKSSPLEKKYIDLLENNLKTVTSPFGTEISRIMPKLTPRENEICNMIRGGLSSKEIARLLNISYRSVETYRNFIRKKLGLINKKVNLTSYLNSL